MILPGNTPEEWSAYGRAMRFIHERYGPKRKVQRARRKTRPERKTIANTPFDEETARAIVSLVCYHGDVSVRALLKPRAARWTQDLRAAAAWLLCDRFELTAAAVSFRLATTPKTVFELLALAEKLRRSDPEFVHLIDRVRTDLAMEAAA